MKLLSHTDVANATESSAEMPASADELDRRWSVAARIRLVLGGTICGGFLGSFAGALCGMVYGTWAGDLALGLDGALIGSLIAAAAGAVYGLICTSNPTT